LIFTPRSVVDCHPRLRRQPLHRFEVEVVVVVVRGEHDVDARQRVDLDRKRHDAPGARELHGRGALGEMPWRSCSHFQSQKLALGSRG
jgi:hypothetical protein